MLARGLMALLLAGSLSGCVALDADPDRSPVTGGDPPTGADAGSASTHRDPQRSESAVSVTREGEQFVAIRTITISNDFGGADGATLEFTTRAGGIAVEDGSGGGYRIVAVLKSRADTDAAARKGLDRLSVTHDDDLGEDLGLTTEVHFPDGSSGLSGGITATLPRGPAYRVGLDTSSGGIEVSGLKGPSIDAQTSSGGIEIAGAYTRVKARASSGGVDLDATARDVDVVIGSGGIEARLRPMGSGDWHLEAGSGGVAVELVRDGSTGFDVEADAGSGGVEVSVRGSEEVGAQSARHAHVRTTGYDDAAAQVEVDALTGSGGVDVSDGD